MTIAQIYAVVALLLAFGVPQNTVNNIQTMLQATTTPPIEQSVTIPVTMPVSTSTPVVTTPPAPTDTIVVNLQHAPIAVKDNAVFDLQVQDPNGNNIERPVIKVDVGFNGATTTISTSDKDYPYSYHHSFGKDDWGYSFNPGMTQPGIYTFVFSAYGVSTSTQITVD